MSEANVLTAVVPGSFDPVTVGHLDLISRAVRLIGSATVLIMQNPYKGQGFLPVEKRLEMLRFAVRELPAVSVAAYDGLLADYCAAHHGVLVKGARTASDFEYEASMASINRSVSGVETVILPADPSLSFISSTMVRELIRYGKDPSPYLPDGLSAFLK